VVVTSPSVKTLVRKFTPGIFAMPPAFIVICVEKALDAHPLAEVTYLANCAIAVQNIMLAAYGMGIGTCVVLSYAKAAIAEILNIPEGVEPLLVLTLGYPAEAPEPPPRLELNQIAFMDEYGKSCAA
jgi:nitroreductase